VASKVIVGLFNQIVDILTKPLSKANVVYFRDKIGVVGNASLAERECRCLG